MFVLVWSNGWLPLSNAKVYSDLTAAGSIDSISAGVVAVVVVSVVDSGESMRIGACSGSISRDDLQKRHSFLLINCIQRILIIEDDRVKEIIESF